MAGLLALVIGGCNGIDPAPGPVNDVGAEPANVAAALDTLASDAGVLPVDQARPPEGSYGRSYAGGRDRLCLLSASGDGGAYRFGVELRIGADQGCSGRGLAVADGDRLTFEFAGAGECRVVARYDGDVVALPGQVEPGCARYCTRRASLAGFTLPRTGDGDAMARKVTDSADRPLCR